MSAQQAYEEGARYRGFILYAAQDGLFWVVGEERWMTEDEMDELATANAATDAERAALGVERI